MREIPDDDATTTLREYYRHFARIEAAPVSGLYQDWAEGVAADEQLLRLLLQLPRPKRQANLLFAAARLCEVPLQSWGQVREVLLRRWEDIQMVMRNRRTQTNEPGRLGVLNVAFAQIAEETGQPLALLEVGASAGLCLYPDAWPVRYSTASDDVVLTPSGTLNTDVELQTQLQGLPAPQRLPQVAWRGGIDLNPLDLRDSEDLRWLQALVWPGMEYRLHRLQAGARLAAEAPPRLIRGDLNELLTTALEEVPAGAVPVIFHSAVLVYLSGAERERFVEQLRSLGARWVSNEGLGVFPHIAAKLPGQEPDRSGFILALDGEPLARTGPHGQYAHSLH